MVTVIYPIFRHNHFFCDEQPLRPSFGKRSFQSFAGKFKVCVQEKKLRTSKKIHLEHQLCTWQCSKCLSTPLKVVENAILQHRPDCQVSLGMCGTNHVFNDDSSGSKCVKHFFSGQTLTTSYHFFPRQNACFYALPF